MTEPKLIIDSDWKSAAQAEKEKLAEKAAPKVKAGEEEDREVGFEDVVGMLAQGALTYMGFVPDPYSGQAMVSLELAKLHIDMLGVVEVKTKGNLNEEETAALTKTVSQLKMAFVEVQQAVSKAVAEGKIKPRSAGGMGGMGGMGMGGPDMSGGLGGVGGGLVMPE